MHGALMLGVHERPRAKWFPEKQAERGKVPKLQQSAYRINKVNTEVGADFFHFWLKPSRVRVTWGLLLGGCRTALGLVWTVFPEACSLTAVPRGLSSLAALVTAN